MLCLLSNTPKIGYVAVDRYPEFLAGWVGAGGGHWDPVLATLSQINLLWTRNFKFT